MPTTIEVTVASQTLLLNSDRTVYWPGQQVLLVADLHAGKTEHLRRHGIAIPAGSLATDLKRLSVAISQHNPKRLLFLGDLFHSEINDEWYEFMEWCQRQTCSIELVRGNHDRFIDDATMRSGGLIVHAEPYTLPPFKLQHYPAKPNNPDFVLAGHIHPVYWTFGAAKDRLRLPCFWLQQRQLILPSFGSFTGGYAVNKLPAEAIYVCSPDAQTIAHVK